MDLIAAMRRTELLYMQTDLKEERLLNMDEVCAHCHRKGHTEKQCFKKHPELKRQNGTGRRAARTTLWVISRPTPTPTQVPIKVQGHAVSRVINAVM
jgi:hypothetical protein